ncbi:MAG: hypothetical protein V1792_00265 [Pseudomonadota bacterium]
MDAFTMESIPVSLQDVMNEPKSKPTNRLKATPMGVGREPVFFSRNPVCAFSR